MGETKGLVRLLLRRDDVLSGIRDGPIRIRELTDRVAVSRPTVHRSLKELRKHDLIEQVPRGYVLTPYGESVLDKYRSILEEFDQVRENRELLLALDETRLPPAVLNGAAYTTALPFAPEKPFAEIEDVARGATEIRAFTPVIVARYVSLFYEQVTEGSLRADTLTTTDVFEYLTSQWPTEFDEAIDAGLDVAVVDESLPFGLVVAEKPDPEICVIVYESGNFRGVIRNDSRDAVEWGRDVYRSYRQSARRPERLAH
jgi:predicted transcriptional regulator